MSHFSTIRALSHFRLLIGDFLPNIFSVNSSGKAAIIIAAKTITSKRYFSFGDCKP
jgi:hypothetical protein